MQSSTQIDNNKISFYGENGLDINGVIINNNLNDPAYSSLLKVSHCTNVTGNNLIIGQGYENSADIDCAQNVTLNGDFGASGIPCHCVITVKGGCRNVNLSGKIHTPETIRIAHLECGGWMDQSYKINKNIILDFTGQDKVYVTIGWAVPFTIKLRGNCKYLLWKSLELKLYWIAKFMIRLVLRIPKGTKGPSWF